MNATTKKDPTAAEQYATERETIRVLMAQIDLALARHNEKRQLDHKNWGFTGDLCHVVEQLQGAAKFLERAAPWQQPKEAR